MLKENLYIITMPIFQVNDLDLCGLARNFHMLSGSWHSSIHSISKNDSFSPLDSKSQKEEPTEAMVKPLSTM